MDKSQRDHGRRCCTQATPCTGHRMPRRRAGLLATSSSCFSLVSRVWPGHGPAGAGRMTGGCSFLPVGLLGPSHRLCQCLCLSRHLSLPTTHTYQQTFQTCFPAGSPAHQRQRIQVQIPGAMFASCVALGQLLNLSVPPLSPPGSWDKLGTVPSSQAGSKGAMQEL